MGRCVPRSISGPDLEDNLDHDIHPNLGVSVPMGEYIYIYI